MVAEASVAQGAQVEAGRLPEAAALCREALQDNPDDWTMLQTCLDCLLPSTQAARRASHGSDGGAGQQAAALGGLCITGTSPPQAPDSEVGATTAPSSTLPYEYSRQGQPWARTPCRHRASSQPDSVWGCKTDGQSESYASSLRRKRWQQQPRWWLLCKGTKRLRSCEARRWPRRR